MLARMMSMSLTVRSSSPRPPVPSIRIEGRTWGGGTGSTVRIIQSGRAYSGLNLVRGRGRVRVRAGVGVRVGVGVRGWSWGQG